MTEKTRTYLFHLHPESLIKAERYLRALQQGNQTAGSLLAGRLAAPSLKTLTVEAFLEAIISTKRPQIFAESAVVGDGSDWNLEELSILGDIGVSVPVIVFDNGRHSQPEVHSKPFEATLLYVPGALLRSGSDQPPADWAEVVRDGQIDQQAYNRLYERRLLPLLAHANAVSTQRPAVITIPGLGCGAFAGRFHGTLEARLQQALFDLLTAHHAELPNIRAVYYDPYQQGENQRFEIGYISLLVRPLMKGNQHKPQLCPPTAYAEEGDNFSGCQLFSFVAWDHVSWPGNDFYSGSRSTDDGVKAAATSSMAVITGIEGRYNQDIHQYQPPEGYRNWGEVVSRNKIELEVEGLINTEQG